MKRKLKLEEVKIESFVTSQQVEGGNPITTHFLCIPETQVTNCLVIGTNQMMQCIEGPCGS